MDVHQRNGASHDHIECLFGLNLVDEAPIVDPILIRGTLQEMKRKTVSFATTLLLGAVLTSAFGEPIARAPKFLSAFWGLNDAMPQQICPAATQLDGMPVTFSWLIDSNSIEPSDFRILRSDGTETTPTCATLIPANEPNETQTILLIGDVGDSAAGIISRNVRLVGQLVGHAPNSAQIKRFGNLKSPHVRSLGYGPYIVDAWILQPQLLANDANRCAVGSTFLRVVWSGGITDYPTANEVGDDVTAAYRVVYSVKGAQPVSIAPLAIGDLNDGDNMHDLCLPELPKNAKIWSVELPENLVQDPNGDPNPPQKFKLNGIKVP